MADDLRKELLDRHARAQEYAVLDAEARSMTAEAFSAKHAVSLKPDFPGSLFKVVQVDGVDYYWSRRDNAYDGWGMKS